MILRLKLLVVHSNVSVDPFRFFFLDCIYLEVYHLSAV